MSFIQNIGFVAISILLVSSCGGGGSNTKEINTPVDDASNIAPVASVTSTNDFTGIGLKEFVLDGSGSSDTDGTIANYLWSQTSGSAAKITSFNESKLHFIPGNIDESLSFQLTVTDNNGATHKSEVNVKITPYFKKLNARRNNYCAIVAENNGDDVYCWLNNESPQVTNPKAVYVGLANYCAVDDNGTQCWGLEITGINEVPALVDVKKITFSGAYACALDVTGVQCWGNAQNRNELPDLPVLTNPVDIVSSIRNVCALDESAVYCWGWHDLEVPELHNVQAIYGGDGTFICALDDDGVVCWDIYGTVKRLDTQQYKNIQNVALTDQNVCVLASNDTDESNVTCFNYSENTISNTISNGVVETIPTMVSPRELATTADSACVIDDTGIVCWGSSYDDHTQPPQFSDINILSSGFNHSCAIGNLEDNENILSCWGSNNYDMKNLPSFENPFYLSANDDVSCFIDDNGPLCWGYDIMKVIGTWGDDWITKNIELPNWNNVTALEPGINFICALTSNGVECAGKNNTYGQLDVPEFANPTALVAGDTFACVSNTSGVKCWGNIYGSPFDVPTPILNNPTSLTAEDNHACAIADNKVHCWGNNLNGKLAVPELVNPIKVVAGHQHTCALDDNGITCWGNNQYGETNVPTLSNPTDITVAFRYSCAKDDSGLVCWGWNGFGGTPIPLKSEVNASLAGLTPMVHKSNLKIKPSVTKFGIAH